MLFQFTFACFECVFFSIRTDEGVVVFDFFYILVVYFPVTCIRPVCFTVRVFPSYMYSSCLFYCLSISRLHVYVLFVLLFEDFPVTCIRLVCFTVWVFPSYMYTSCLFYCLRISQLHVYVLFVLLFEYFPVTCIRPVCFTVSVFPSYMYTSCLFYCFSVSQLHVYVLSRHFLLLLVKPFVYVHVFPWVVVMWLGK